ncbi:DUF1570 domain-containing protein [Blastopirellula marina]|uniref:DUF1570 domain-containing protein n=1 Tax=Blastopirellula marina TaxID=124 RepID=A0A2S8GDG0_9BACT|nr:DUF1570 domain-containing protein [Blastopirellula marina]PQO42496.1 hypothetical protein C5Y93_29670 [Blastopirellula marina]
MLNRRPKCPLVWIAPAFLALSFAVNPLWAQGTQSVPRARVTVPDPRAFGLDIPPGLVLYDIQGNVEFRNEEGGTNVGKIHVAIGNHVVIQRPDGKLITRKATEVKMTDRTFEGIDRKVLEQRLREEHPGFRTLASRHFVFVYNTSREFAQGTMRIMESMLPGVMAHAKRQKIDVHDPEVPLVVIMFATEAEYKQFAQLPDGVVAYYDTMENHVVMYERPSKTPFKWELYYRQAISTISHEGAHQILHNIGVQQRLSRWPMWLSEGIAEYYAPTEFGRRMRWKGAGDINDMRMFELESYLKARDANQADGAMVDDTIGASRLTSTGYASAWALTHYLASRHKLEFDQFMKKVSETRPLEGALALGKDGKVTTNREVFQEFFGSDFAGLERDLVKHLKAQPYDHPFKEFIHFVASVRININNRIYGTANVFHSEQLAAKWQQEQIRKLDAAQQQQATIEMAKFPNRPAAERAAAHWLRTNN